MSHDGAEVRASISLTLNSLSPDAQRLFRLLAVSNAQSFPSWIGSPLLEADVLGAQELLEELTEAYLIDAVTDPVSGQIRYQFHDIMWPLARERLMADESTWDREKALERLFGALLYLAGEAHQRVYQGGLVLPRSGASRWPLPEALVDRLLKDPLAWYEGERQTLVSAVTQAAASGRVEAAWDLALSTVTIFEAHAHYDDWRRTHETALKAACQAGDGPGEAAMRYSLGSLYMFERLPDEASRQLSQALSLYRKLDDRRGKALTLRNIAYLNRIDGDLELAVARWEEALGTLQILGDRVAEAHILHNLAQVHLELGDDEAAEELLDRAQRICEDFGNRRVGGQVSCRIGELRLGRGEFDGAAEAYRQALAAVREIHDPIGECYALLGLVGVELKRGDLRAAAATLTDAVELAALAGDPLVCGRLTMARAELALQSGQSGIAADYCNTAIGAFEVMKASSLHAEALRLRGRIRAAAAWPGATAVSAAADGYPPGDRRSVTSAIDGQ